MTLCCNYLFVAQKHKSRHFYGKGYSWFLFLQKFQGNTCVDVLRRYHAVSKNVHCWLVAGWRTNKACSTQLSWRINSVLFVCLFKHVINKHSHNITLSKLTSPTRQAADVYLNTEAAPSTGVGWTHHRGDRPAVLLNICTLSIVFSCLFAARAQIKTLHDEYNM